MVNTQKSFENWKVLDKVKSLLFLLLFIYGRKSSYKWILCVEMG